METPTEPSTVVATVPQHTPRQIPAAPFTAVLALLFVIALSSGPVSTQWNHSEENYRALAAMNQTVQELQHRHDLGIETSQSLKRLDDAIAKLKVPIDAPETTSVHAAAIREFIDTLQPFWLGLWGALGVLAHLVIVRRPVTVPLWDTIVDFELGAVTASAVTLVFYQFEHVTSNGPPEYGPFHYLLAAWIGYSYRDVIQYVFTRVKRVFENTMDAGGQGRQH